MKLRAAAGCFVIALGLIGGGLATRGYGQVDRTRHDVQVDLVRDLKTGLTWQRAVPAEAVTLEGATQYCANLALGGRDDWRLPSLQEFQTIVDERRANPAVDPEIFPATPSQGFWSGTRWSGTPMLAWHVDFGIGNAAYDTATMTYRIRCVRWGP